MGKSPGKAIEVLANLSSVASNQLKELIALKMSDQGPASVIENLFSEADDVDYFIIPAKNHDFH